MGSTENQTTLRERRTLLFHTVKRLGIGEEVGEQAFDPQQIVLLNREEIDSDLPSGGKKETA